MKKKTFKDIDVAGKRVFVRVDFNVPQDDSGKITDDTRIRAALPTINYLVKQNAKVILCSHLGRPKGVFNDKYSLAPVAERLSELMNMPVKMAKDVIGTSAKTMTSEMKEGEIVILENVRFHAEEEENNEVFAKELASLADVFVNDAFGTAHRAHASTAGIAKHIPAVAGFLMDSEVVALSNAVENAEKPLVVILGGAKVSDKINVILKLMSKANTLLIGGAMANTFLVAKGYNIGFSKYEEDRIEVAKEIMEEAEKLNVKLVLPVDVVGGSEFSPTAKRKNFDVENIGSNYQALDIGKKTRKLFAKEIKNAKTVIWNGPMGVFEFKKFRKGTLAVAKAVAKSGAVSIVGGGDSVAAIQELGFANKVTHLSTGGGATLKFLEGATLPGVAMLEDKDSEKKKVKTPDFASVDKKTLEKPAAKKAASAKKPTVKSSKTKTTKK
ncbi:MAG: phosphoglycerate kinase [Clostridia bacterium]|nr:phosphoglycerate kinase [Clostridia bacterium]